MPTRIVLFVQAVLTFMLGLYLSAQGLPSDGAEATIMVGEKTLDEINKVNPSEISDNITANGKLSLHILGVGMTIASILEIILLGVSLFKS